MKTPADINATTTILGLVTRTSEKWLDILAEYRGERTPAAIGEIVHKALLVADKVNHTNGTRLFFWCNWATIGAHLLQLAEDDRDERHRRRPVDWWWMFSRQTHHEPAKHATKYKP